MLLIKRENHPSIMSRDVIICRKTKKTSSAFDHEQSFGGRSGTFCGFYLLINVFKMHTLLYLNGQYSRRCRLHRSEPIFVVNGIKDYVHQVEFMCCSVGCRIWKSCHVSSFLFHVFSRQAKIINIEVSTSDIVSFPDLSLAFSFTRHVYCEYLTRPLLT